MVAVMQGFTVRWLSVAAVLVAALLVGSCTRAPTPARAHRIESRAELIGGKRALGEIGDYKLSNGLIHAVVQNVGTSRGFGTFGGSLIDVDLVRGTDAKPSQAPVGNDQFTEMFPAFALTAIEPSNVEVLQDGSDGGPAIIRVSGGRGDFISFVSSINDIVFPQQGLQFAVDYVLEPGKQYLKIVTHLQNVSSREINFAAGLPMGFVTLLGAGQRLFVPGKAGYDIRFRLDDVYKQPSTLDAFAGEVTSMVATDGNGVSYAVAASPRGASYLPLKPDAYPTAKPDSLLVPLASGSFLGTFWGRNPDRLAAGKEYVYTGYLAVGSGDIASVQKVIYGIADEGGRQPVTTGALSGRVRESGTLMPLHGVSVVLQNEQGDFVSQARTESNGLFTAPLLPGRYRAHAVDAVRGVSTSSEYVDVTAGGTAVLNLELSPPALLKVVVRDSDGRPLPSKVSVEGLYEHVGPEPLRDFFYDLKVGQRPTPSDLLDDAADPSTRRYLEQVFYAPAGAASGQVRPGRYRVYASRGVEYSLESAEVELSANQTTEVALTLKHELPTLGWASADFHVHSILSVDSDIALPDRVLTYAAEGIDLVTSSDHNYVADFAPTIEAMSLADWLHSTVGLELTTLEMGHFNGFPLKVEPGPVTHGSFAWFLRPPGELFAQLRGLGVDQANTVVQVNHPRDSIQGYFSTFNLSTQVGVPYKGSATSADTDPLPDGGVSPYHPSQLSFDFDALEVFNGKREELIYAHPVPAVLPPGAAPKLPTCAASGKVADCVPNVGEIPMETHQLYDGGTVLQPAFAGAQDDWFTLLAQGRRITATGNSDSHGFDAEAGLPRTYLQVGATADGSMRGLSVSACMEALKTGRALVTNGPFVEAWVNGHQVGDTVVASDGAIDVHVKVQAASWVDVSKVAIRRGGKDQGLKPFVLDEIAVPKSRELLRLDVTRHYEGVPDGSFIVVEVKGDETMWPVFTPNEIPALQLADAVSVVGSAFGFSDTWGRYKPALTNAVRPYAFTNPIWVDRTLKQQLRAPKRVLPVSSSATFRPRSVNDLRKVFGALHSDYH